jgi:enoyl-CoA hydratase/carnithine racemase
MAGQKVQADEALQWGLVDRITAAETLLETAQTLGQDVLKADQSHIAAIKAMIV